MKRVLAFVPARKCSKGLPGKNTRLFAGKPLVAYTLEAAKACMGMDVFVSTDDDQVIAVAEGLDLGTEYRRPSSLAGDGAAMADVVTDGLTWLAARGRKPEVVVLLQPTSPLRLSADIEGALELFFKSRAPTVVGVSPMWTHPTECLQRRGANWEYLVQPKVGAVRRQDYDGEYLFINGAIYIMWSERFLVDRTFVAPNSELYCMDSTNTVDIDYERDFIVAEALMRRRQGVKANDGT